MIYHYHQINMCLWTNAQENSKWNTTSRSQKCKKNNYYILFIVIWWHYPRFTWSLDFAEFDSYILVQTWVGVKMILHDGISTPPSSESQK